MRKNIVYAIVILLIGFIGGMTANLILPSLADLPPFSYINLIEYLSDGTTIINTTEEITITENQALSEAISKVSPALVVIEAYQGQVLQKQGSGFVVTADGLVITAADLIPTYHTKIMVVHQDWQQEASVQQVDLENGLALLQIEKNNLPVVSMVDLNQLQLGQRVILIGCEKDTAAQVIYHFINIGHIRSIKDQTLSLNLEEGDVLANGGPLVDIKGQVIGLNSFDKVGLRKTITVAKIKKMIFTP